MQSPAAGAPASQAGGAFQGPRGLEKGQASWGLGQGDCSVLDNN